MTELSRLTRDLAEMRLERDISREVWLSNIDNLVHRHHSRALEYEQGSMFCVHLFCDHDSSPSLFDFITCVGLPSSSMMMRRAISTHHLSTVVCLIP